MKGSQEERFEAALKQAVEHLQSQRQVSTEQRAASWERLASEAQRAMRRSQRPRLHWGAWAAAAAAMFVIVGFWLGRASVDSRGPAVTRAPAVNKLRPEPASKERSATAKSEPPTRIEETVPRKTVNTGRRLASGARLETSHDAVFSIERDEAVRGVISLDAGRVSLEVPKLEAGATLAVRTKGARVVVHGTRFSVARSAGNTEITVSEGVVEVISLQTRETSTFLSAGESMRLEDGTLRLARLENALERSLADLDYSTYA
ncbi:MAG: FecR family protein, partial [Myxococcota bacterium]